MGSIFGPQLYDAIRTANNVLDQKIAFQDKDIMAKYPDIQKGQGQNIVIFNILQDIRSQSTNPEINKALDALFENTTITNAVEDQMSLDLPDTHIIRGYQKCSMENLLLLAQEHRSFQPLFAQAIERINGSSSVLAPDLVARLSGREKIPSMEESKKAKEEDKKLEEEQESLFKMIFAHSKKIDVKKAGAIDNVDVGDIEFIQMKKGLMAWMDNVKMNANGSKENVKIELDKSWDINKRQHEMENSFLKDLLGAGVAVDFHPDRKDNSMTL